MSSSQLIFTFLFAMFFVACSTDQPSLEIEGSDSKNIKLDGTRGVSAKGVKFETQYINLVLNNQEGTNTVQSIKGKLFTAESNKKLLAVQLSASQDSVSEGMFVFSLKAEKPQTLNLKIYDEEGYELGHNKTNIHTGDNYRALNVTEFTDGTYLMRLSDSLSGAELTHQFIIKN